MPFLEEEWGEVLSEGLPLVPPGLANDAGGGTLPGPAAGHQGIANVAGGASADSS